jgi:type IV secretory pathway VirB3-like protein
MFGFIEIFVILAVASLAVAPIVVIIYLLYKIAKKQEANPKISVPEQIERLAKLKDQGVLSETEFEEKKKELLARI